MKVTKRDGRVVDYDRNKIIIAIQKANAEVDRYNQVDSDKIESIVAGIENQHVDNLMVEDIQDMIEQLPVYPSLLISTQHRQYRNLFHPRIKVSRLCFSTISSV